MGTHKDRENKMYTTRYAVTYTLNGETSNINVRAEDPQDIALAISKTISGNSKLTNQITIIDYSIAKF